MFANAVDAGLDHGQVYLLSCAQVGEDGLPLDNASKIGYIINANTTARLILGLSKCGMHGDEPVRLKRLKRPWIDQD